VALAPILAWKPKYNALKPQVALSPCTIYLWQVRAHCPCGKREISPVFDFTTQYARPRPLTPPGGRHRLGAIPRAGAGPTDISREGDL
jgi:hypothetical protein